MGSPASLPELGSVLAGRIGAHLEFGPSSLACQQLGSDQKTTDFRGSSPAHKRGGYQGAYQCPQLLLLSFLPSLGPKSQHPDRPSFRLLLPSVCRQGLAVPGAQRELPGELPAAVPGEPGSAA